MPFSLWKAIKIQYESFEVLIFTVVDDKKKKFETDVVNKDFSV